MVFTDGQKRFLELAKSGKNILLTGSAGCGKCLGYNTQILMFDGTTKMVQDIKIGDELMGDDNTKRIVLNTNKGKSDMYKVKQVKGVDYVVNEHHILSLKLTYTTRSGTSGNLCKHKFINGKKYKKGDIVDISIKDYLNLSTNSKKTLKGFKVPVTFPKKDLPFDPYLLGLWLGDGTSSNSGITSQDSTILKYLVMKLPEYGCYLSFRPGGTSGYAYNICGKKMKESKSNRSIKNHILTSLRGLNLINNKHIPDIFKYNSRDNLLKLLAGLIDTDGYYNNCTYEITQKNEKLAKDIEFIVKCLGLYSSVKKVTKSCMSNGKKVSGTYYKQHISGSGVSEIPCLIPRKQSAKRKQIKNILHTGIKIEKLGNDYFKQGREYEYYYGFELDGNHRFLLGDFTVTHNSHIINEFYDWAQEMYPDRVHKTATTGIAALNIGGRTIHSWAGVGLCQGSVNDLLEHMFFQTKKKWQRTRVLIIDEVSMMAPEMLDKLSEIGRILNRSSKPFGNIQVILISDFLQLPPVKNPNFAFEAKCWNDLIDETVELTENVRQKGDIIYQTMLNEIRLGDCSKETETKLRERVGVDLTTKNGIEPTRLYPKNRSVNSINTSKLRALKAKPVKFEAQYKIRHNYSKRKKKDLLDYLRKNTQVPDTITLKEGAQIVFKLNIPEWEVVNGTRGVVKEFSEETGYPVVELIDERRITVTPQEFKYELKDSKLNPIKKGFLAVKTQIPIKLCWSMSIHSSQGTTLDLAIVDCGDNVFSEGQAYTALSRVKSLEGLSLTAFDSDSIMANQRVIDFYASIETT